MPDGNSGGSSLVGGGHAEEDDWTVSSSSCASPIIQQQRVVFLSSSAPTQTPANTWSAAELQPLLSSKEAISSLPITSLQQLFEPPSPSAMERRYESISTSATNGDVLTFTERDEVEEHLCRLPPWWCGPSSCMQRAPWCCWFCCPCRRRRNKEQGYQEVT
jgi:hypothetical protein